MGKLYLGDCLEVMKKIPDGSIDMILADLPYGTTACKWDEVIPMKPLWEQYNRVIKENAAICLFAGQPFAANLIVSNLQMFRYEWIWEKARATLFQHANKMPMRKHEEVLIFYKKLPTYNPQFTEGKPYIDLRTGRKGLDGIVVGGAETKKIPVNNDGRRFPVSVISGFCDVNRKHLHPTQKPTRLLEYLVKTYTDEGETVLDNCMGSGSTGVACKNLNRNFIGIEKEPKYFEIAKKRIEGARREPTQTELQIR